MAITANDIVVYASAVMPTGDNLSPGGAIDTTVKMTFTDMAATDGLVMSSNGLNDEVKVDVTGRNAGGSIVTDQFVVYKTLSRIPGINATSFERILRMAISSGSHTGTITIEQDNNPTYTPIGTMPSGVSGIYRPFYNVSSSATNAKEYFEKCFIKNNNSVNALLTAFIAESGEFDLGGTEVVSFDLSSTGNDDGASSNNRLGPPPSTQLLSGQTGAGFTNTAKAVVGEDLAAGSYQGMWLKLDLAAGAASQNGFWGIVTSGNTTA